MSDAVHPEQSAVPGFVGLTLSVSLTVSDVQRSMAWYRDVLGFAVRKAFERDGRMMAASMFAGEVRILLTQDDGAHGTDREKGAGFSIMITTAQSIDALATQIQSHGVTLDTEPMDMRGERFFRLRDPDGFKLTISSGMPS